MLYSRESRTTVLFLALVTSLTVLCHSVDVTTVFTTSTITEITTVTAAPQPQNKAETALNTATNIIQTMQFLFNCAPFKWKGPLKITSCALNFIVLLLTAWGYLLKYLQENKLNSDADMETSVPVRRKQPAEMSTHDRRRKLGSAIPRFVYRDML